MNKDASKAPENINDASIEQDYAPDNLNYAPKNQDYAPDNLNYAPKNQDYAPGKLNYAPKNQDMLSEKYFRQLNSRIASFLHVCFNLSLCFHFSEILKKYSLNVS